MWCYYELTTVTGTKKLTRQELEEMIYFILTTGQVKLNEIPYLFRYDEIKDSPKFENYLRIKIRGSAFRIARYLFGEDKIVYIQNYKRK